MRWLLFIVSVLLLCRLYEKKAAGAVEKKFCYKEPRDYLVKAARFFGSPCPNHHFCSVGICSNIVERPGNCFLNSLPSWLLAIQELRGGRRHTFFNGIKVGVKIFDNEYLWVSKTLLSYKIEYEDTLHILMLSFIHELRQQVSLSSFFKNSFK